MSIKKVFLIAVVFMFICCKSKTPKQLTAIQIQDCQITDTIPVKHKAKTEWEILDSICEGKFRLWLPDTLKILKARNLDTSIFNINVGQDSTIMTIRRYYDTIVKNGEPADTSGEVSMALAFVEDYDTLPKEPFRLKCTSTLSFFPDSHLLSASRPCIGYIFDLGSIDFVFKNKIYSYAYIRGRIGSRCEHEIEEDGTEKYIDCINY